MATVPLRAVRIIWAALVVATLIYWRIAILLCQKNVATPFAGELHDLFAQLIYGMALITFAVAFFMRGFMRDRGRPAHLYNIVSWALFEASAIYGLVLSFVKLDWRLIVAPEMLAIVGFGVTFPQE